MKLEGKNSKNHSIKRRKNLKEFICFVLKGDDMNSKVGGNRNFFLV
jgi:hypothetical protein